MKKLLFTFIASLTSAAAIALPVSSPLIVVEDSGGVSALSWYQALTPQQTDETVVPHVPTRVGTENEAEAAMLPVHSELLSPGEEAARVIRAPGLLPLFLIGEDAHSREWLEKNHNRLTALKAAGLVVNVSTADTLSELRRIAPELTLSPTQGDDLARRLGIRHYPVLITAAGIEP